MSDISKIALALSKAQAKIQPPEKNRTVEVKDRDGKKLYEFDYADYNAIVGAIRGPLSENEIAFTHTIENVGGWLLITRLIHSSGEELRSTYPLPNSADPKTLGGAITYGKRYCLSALTGCVADDDIDAETHAEQTFKNKPPTKPPVKPLGDEHTSPEQRVKPVEAPVTPIVIPETFCGQEELEEIKRHRIALGLPTEVVVSVLEEIGGTPHVSKIPISRLGAILGEMEDRAYRRDGY